MAMFSNTTADFETFNSKLFTQINRQNSDENIFFSPASIALAISMCTIGARNETLQQMLNVFEASSIQQITKTAEQIMHVFSLANKDKKVQLKLANRLYAQKDYKLQGEYLSLVQKSFQADIKLEDFQNQSEKVVQTINAWVEEQTNTLIRNLLTKSDVTNDTRLILVNCIYFKGAWINPFDKYLTDAKANFYEANGKVTKISLMHQTDQFQYNEDKSLGVQMIHLPYENSNSKDAFVFSVILPDKNVRLEDVEQKLTVNPQLMKQTLNLNSAKSRTIELYLPKFKMESKFQLNYVLIQLGMSNAFQSQVADFSGIVSREDARNGLYISKVIHKAFISVDEEGSEAAAATAIIMVDECCMMRDVEELIKFRIDRPFLFAIQEARSGLVLFQGKFLTTTQLSN
ncbi:hypothetical protein I4U23_002687 [Adineta vaga]|nr:hypothetical protein I4U23_002687 [Adineta vaga]